MNCINCSSAHTADRGDGTYECSNCGYVWLDLEEPRVSLPYLLLALAFGCGMLVCFSILRAIPDRPAR